MSDSVSDVNEQQDVQPNPLDAFDWPQLAADVWTLMRYGQSKHDAVKSIIADFRQGFLNRLYAQMKSERTAQWKQETYERLKKEFEQERK